MSGKGCGRKRSWTNLRYNPSISIEGPRKTTKRVTTACLLAKISIYDTDFQQTRSAYASKLGRSFRKVKTPRSVLSLSSDEGSSCSSENKQDERTAPRPKLTASTERIQNKVHNPEKLSWVWAPMKMSAVPRKRGTIERRQDQRCLFRRGNYSNNCY
jgi:hypothetical protein